MPIFAIRCLDKPGALALRMEHRPEHLAYLGSLDEVRVAGALLDDEDRPIGSLVIVETEAATVARALAEGDPFSILGVFQSVEISPWRVSIGSV